MMKAMLKKIIIFIILSLGIIHAQADDFLPPEKAFQAIAQLQNDSTIAITVLPANGYYIYKDSLQFKFAEEIPGLSLGRANLSPAKSKYDENFGKSLEIYPKEFLVKLPIKISKDQSSFTLVMQLQGCAEHGICYPPMELSFSLNKSNALISGVHIDESLGASAQTFDRSVGIRDFWAARDDASALAKLLQGISIYILIAVFFVLGLGMSLTPCVLPMLPIMSTVVFGSKTANHQDVSKVRSSFLAIAYVLGMALMYSSAGMLTAALGANIQAFLQSPWVLGMFAFLLLALAASLFGFYELRLPSRWHNIIDRVAGKQEGGSIVGAFFLGAISTLIASPCITAPLAGVLAFVAQTGSISLGGLLLFVMALGMGLPLMLFAIGARGLVPKAGSWMRIVQKIFGTLLVALAVWVALPIFTQKESAQATHTLSSGLVFQRVNNLSELDALIAKAKKEGKPILLDFYADWCVTCKEMELLTFGHADVVKALSVYQLIQIDVTKNTPEQIAVLKRYGLLGPPAILFLDEDGHDLTAKRVVGFMKPERFLTRLE
jgi:thiol:disulfide interchange protein DsbD